MCIRLYARLWSVVYWCINTEECSTDEDETAKGISSMLEMRHTYL